MHTHTYTFLHTLNKELHIQVVKSLQIYCNLPLPLTFKAETGSNTQVLQAMYQSG